MLAYILAVLVGTGSVGLYIAAFFLPEIHRKHDFIWSGVGFFYALVLWIYARQIAGGILVGQTASVALLGWFAWQTLKLRRQLVPVNQQTPLPTKTQLQAQLGLKPSPQKLVNPTPKTPTKPKATIINPQTIPTPPPSTIAEVASVDVNTPARSSITPPATIPNPAIEDATSEEDEAWIKLEIKPSPTAATRLGEATKPSAPPPPAPTDASHIPVELDSEHDG